MRRLLQLTLSPGGWSDHDHHDGSALGSMPEWDMSNAITHCSSSTDREKDEEDAVYGVYKHPAILRHFSQ
jgi:hypothetical protein